MDPNSAYINPVQRKYNFNRIFSFFSLHILNKIKTINFYNVIELTVMITILGRRYV